MTGRAAATASQLVVGTDDGARLAVSVRGAAAGPPRPTVVLAHGWGGSRRVWDAVAARLIEAGHQVVTWDLRGHGDSTLGAEPVGLSRLRDDLITVLDHVDARDVVLAGHSGGGYTALAYAVGRPAEAVVRLRGLALVSTAAYGQDTPAGELRMFGSRPFSWAVRRPALGRKLLGSMYASSVVAEATRRDFAALDRHTRADYFRISCGMDLRPGLGSVVVPTVVVAGTADQIIKPRYAEELAGALPNADFTGVDGAGHMLPLEAPAAVTDTLLDLAR